MNDEETGLDAVSDGKAQADGDAQTNAGDLVSGSVKLTQKSFVDLVTEDLSWRTIRDVLAYDVTRPLNDRSTIDMVDVALEEGLITKAHHKELREEEDVAQENLAQVMLERGLITEEQLREAVEFRRRTGQPMWRTFMQLRMAMPERMLELLTSDIRMPFARRQEPEFARLLVEGGVITRKQLDDAWNLARDSNTELGALLVDSGLATSEQVGRAAARELGLAFDSLEALTEIPPQLLNMIPPSILQRIGALPYRLDDDFLYVAFADPRSIRDMDKLGLMLQMKMTPVLVPKDRLDELMSTYLPLGDVSYYAGAEVDEALDEDARSAVETLNVILRGLINCSGSDIHIEPFRESTRIRFRVDGVLHDFMSINPEVSRQLAARIKTLAGVDISKRHVPQDGHLNIPVDSVARNFRIATVPCTHGEKVALRIVQSEIAFSTFDALGMTARQRHVMNDMLNLPNGLILITGPVGSGKTTSLYACLNSLDCFRHNIMSVEDPVEFEVPGITQIQVDRKRGLTFAVGIRALLRQDPDMIMIGEIRDSETAETATRASLTGTLVLASLHANSAPSAVAALLQLGISPYMVGNAVAAVVFQRLVRRVCTQCAVAVEPDAHHREFLELAAGAAIELRRGVGCQHCLHTGYRGRVAVFELLRVSDEYSGVIYSNPSSTELHQAAETSGMLGLRDHARDMVLNGTTSMDEMLRIL